jgi:transposase
MEPEPIGLETKDKREYRRLCAWNMYQKGFWQKDIAEALGVTEGAVSQWINKAKRDGPDALKAKPPRAHPSRHSEAQKARLVQMLAHGAEAYGFRGDVWTQERIADVIRRAFGVTYHPSHMCRLLKACGWSQQKPRKRASQRDEDAIRRWAEQTWPALKKSA